MEDKNTKFWEFVMDSNSIMFWIDDSNCIYLYKRYS